MKKTLYLFLSVAIVFTACKKEEDTPAPVEGCTDSLAENYNTSATTDNGTCEYSISGGAWITTSAHEIGSMQVLFMGIPVYDTSWNSIETNADSLEPYKLKFNEDASWNEYNQNNEILDGGTWSQNGNNITLVMSDTTIVLNVVSVEKDNAIIELTFSGEDDDGDGYIYSYNLTSTLYFERDWNGFTSNNTNAKTGNRYLNKIRKLKNLRNKK